MEVAAGTQDGDWAFCLSRGPLKECTTATETQSNMVEVSCSRDSGQDDQASFTCLKIDSDRKCVFPSVPELIQVEML